MLEPIFFVADVPKRRCFPSSVGHMSMQVPLNRGPDVQGISKIQVSLQMQA